MSGSTNEKYIKVSIWRGGAGKGEFSTYQVPHLKNQTVLDVVSWVQHNVEPGLTYRFACRVGMCGSCAMMVNGKPMWTCRTHIDKAMAKTKGNETLSIGPLRNFPVIKDLACDMSGFFEKWQRAQARFHPTKTRDEEIEIILPGSSKRKAANAAIECINCGICYAACDVVANNADYLGPAALNRAWTLFNDQRDGDHRDSGAKSRLSAVSGEGGSHNCHSQQGCSNFCPNELNPTASIAGLKRHALLALVAKFTGGGRDN